MSQAMDQFLAEVEQYAQRVNLAPSTVVQRAAKGSGSTWRKWRQGLSSPTWRTMEKVRDFMRDHPNGDRSSEAQ